MKTKEQVLDQVKAILSDKLGVDEHEIEMESHLGTDLGADSIDKVELIMEVEKEFDITIEDSEAENITTVEELYNKVVSLISTSAE